MPNTHHRRSLVVVAARRKWTPEARDRARERAKTYPRDPETNLFLPRPSSEPGSDDPDPPKQPSKDRVKYPGSGGGGAKPPKQPPRKPAKKKKGKKRSAKKPAARDAEPPPRKGFLAGLTDSFRRDE